MKKTLLKRFLLAVTSPLRWLIQYELEQHSASHFPHMNIRHMLFRKAAESTALYVMQNMSNVEAVSSKEELLALAFKQADLKKNALVCEFGVHSGRTINHIASLTDKTIYGFDSFEGLPQKWRTGLDKGHFALHKLPKVRNNVVLVKGWFDKTLPGFLEENSGPAGFLHVDCDLYSSTVTIFDELKDRIHPGCIIVFDEYFNYPGWETGEFKAFQEFVQENNLSYEYLGYNQLHQQVALKIT